MLETTIAGSLPKPSWLAQPRMLWAPWRADGDALAEAKRDATLVALKQQEDAGIDIVTDGEQSRQHFVHGFLEGLEGVDFGRRVKMGIRNNRYDAMVPTVTARLRRRHPVHATEAAIARSHTNHSLKFTLPGPMTIIDTLADAHYGDRVAMAMAFAELLNEEARELEAIGVDVIQFDEPAFNVYLDEVVDWGIAALHRAVEGLTCKTAVHICYGYGIQANIDWKTSLGAEWRQYERIFPALAASRLDQVSLECANSHVPIDLLGLLAGKDVLVGAIDVASDTVETPEQVAAVIERALRFVPAEHLFPCTNCGMAPLDRTLADRKLGALAAGAALVRGQHP
ncbi:MAG TPA: methionine synthase [Stellaceae bacterium]|jgi:5-methyltetrahydropteroyltriglutamate--homocysteine methyltransferase|nr:methionine synthase [Stellaceae bacterium]